MRCADSNKHKNILRVQSTKGERRAKEIKNQTAGQSIFAEYSFIQITGEAKIKKQIRLKKNCELIRIYPRA